MSQTAETKIRVTAKDEATPVLDSVRKALAGLEKELLGIGTLAASAFAGFSIAQYAKDATLMAARYETLGIVMEQAGKNAGYNAVQMHGFERSLVDSGIAMNEARETMVKLAAANIDLSKSAQLARVAQDLAVVGGINSSEALTRMTHGIVSGEVEVLRTLGLNVTFEESYKKLASQLGKNTDALSAQEKMQARVNTVQEAGARYMGIYEASMSTAGKQMTSLARYFSNIKTLAGEAGLQAFSTGIMGITEQAQAAEKALLAMSDSGELARMSQGIGKGFAEGVALIDNAAVSLGAWVVVRKLATSESLKALAADTQLHGGMATAKDRLALLSGAEQKRLATTAAQTQATRALIAEEIRQLEMQALQQAIAARQADLLATRLIGTQNEARGVAVLDAARARLAATTTALATAQTRLAGTTVATAASISGAQLAMNGLRGAGAGVVSFLGGPWVAGLTVAAAAAYGLYEVFSSRDAELEAARKHMLGVADASGDMGKSIDSLQRKVSAVAFKEKMETELEAATKALDDAKRKFEGFSINISASSIMEGLFDKDASSELGKINTVLSDVRSGVISATEGYTRLAELQEQFGKTAPIIAARDALSLLAMAADAVKNAQQGMDRSMYQWLSTLPDAELKVMNTAKAIAVLAERLDAAKAASRGFSMNQLAIPEGDFNKFMGEQSFTKYLNTLDDKSKHVAQSIKKLNGVTEEMIRLTLAGNPPTEQLAKAAKAAGEAFQAPKRSGRSTESALIALQGLNAELAKLEGRKADSFAEGLEKKLMEIARKGKDAGLSLAEVGALQERYSRAAQGEMERKQDTALRKLQAETASALGDDSGARTLKREEDLRRWREELLGLGLTLEQVQPKLEQWDKAQEQKSTIKNAQEAANFYRELGQLSGNYGQSIEAQNQLLQMQAQNLMTNVGISQELADEWMRLQRLEISRDPMAGLERGMRKWSATATDAASQVESALTSAFDSATDAFANFAMTGKMNFNDLINSMLADMARMAAKQMVGGIVGGLGNLLGSAMGSLFGGQFTIGSQDFMGPVGIRTHHTGGVVGRDGMPRMADAALFAEAQRLHRGGYAGLGPDEVPIIGLRGERMLNRAESRAYEAGISAARMPTPRPVPAARSTPAVVINPLVIDRTQKGVAVQQQQTQDGQGNMRWDIIIDELSNGIAARMDAGNSPIGRSMEKNYGVDRATQAYRG